MHATAFAAMRLRTRAAVLTECALAASRAAAPPRLQLRHRRRQALLAARAAHAALHRRMAASAQRAQRALHGRRILAAPLLPLPHEQQRHGACSGRGEADCDAGNQRDIQAAAGCGRAGTGKLRAREGVACGKAGACADVLEHAAGACTP